MYRVKHVKKIVSCKIMCWPRDQHDFPCLSCYVIITKLRIAFFLIFPRSQLWQHTTRWAPEAVGERNKLLVICWAREEELGSTEKEIDNGSFLVG